MTTAPIKRGRGEHGPAPLSIRTRRRMLTAMLELADDGNVAAMEALTRLSFEMEIAAALKPQRGDAISASQQEIVP